MSIVSNTSPLIVLAKAGLLELLPELFSEVVIPQAVRDEIESGPANDPMRVALPNCNWLNVVTPDPPLSPLAAMQLGRGDLAGKTGTTNDQVDAWFCGFNPGLVAISWVGFDQPRTLGGSETGSQAALPMWMLYMGKVLKGVPEKDLVVPDGIVVGNIDGSGKRAVDGKPEYFYRENLPDDRPSLNEGGGNKEDVKNEIF